MGSRPRSGNQSRTDKGRAGTDSHVTRHASKAGPCTRAVQASAWAQSWRSSKDLPPPPDWELRGNPRQLIQHRCRVRKEVTSPPRGEAWPYPWLTCSGQAS